MCVCVCVCVCEREREREREREKKKNVDLALYAALRLHDFRCRISVSRMEYWSTEASKGYPYDATEQTPL